MPSEARSPVTGTEREEGEPGFLFQKEGWEWDGDVGQTTLSEPQVW